MGHAFLNIQREVDDEKLQLIGEMVMETLEKVMATGKLAISNIVQDVMPQSVQTRSGIF